MPRSNAQRRGIGFWVFRCCRYMCRNTIIQCARSLQIQWLLFLLLYATLIRHPCVLSPFCLLSISFSPTSHIHYAGFFCYGPHHHAILPNTARFDSSVDRRSIISSTCLLLFESMLASALLFVFSVIPRFCPYLVVHSSSLLSLSTCFHLISSEQQMR